ncbi:MAG TPA: tryptophan 7-halogenase, partial [Cellvibrionaceae bacterium]
YKASSRTDSAFWRHCREMAIPDTLAHKMEIFASRGHLVMYEPEAFEKESWVTMYMGFDKAAMRYDPRADAMALEDLKKQLQAMQQAIQAAARGAISHDEFIARHCAAQS